MRTYYRLLMFNLAVMAPLTYGVWLHNLRSPTLLVVSIALLFANYVIVNNSVRQRETSTPPYVKLRTTLWSAWTLGPISTAWLPLMFVSLLVKTQFQEIMNLGLMAYCAFSCWSRLSKSEERRINSLANSPEIAFSKTENSVVPSYRSQASMHEVPITKTRPGWVWFIFIWYTFAFVFAAMMEYLVLSKSLPQTSQLEASLSKITTFDYLGMNAHLLLSQTAAIVLFLLRRQATYLFWALFAFNTASNIFYHYIRTNVVQPNKFVGSGGMALIVIGTNLAICLYCEHLNRNGTLT